MGRDEIKKYFQENKLAVYFMLLFIILILGVFYWLGKNYASEQLSTNTSTKTEGGHEIAEGQLVSNFPYFPEYPGSELKGSKMEGVAGDFEGHWEVEGVEIGEVMDWYMWMFNDSDEWEVVEPPPEKVIGEMFTVVRRGDKLYYLTIEKYPNEDKIDIEVEIIPRNLRKDI